MVVSELFKSHENIKSFGVKVIFKNIECWVKYRQMKKLKGRPFIVY